jgi:hypothetical protein
MLARTPMTGIPAHLVDYAKEIERIVNSVARPVIHAEIDSEEATAEWLLVKTLDRARATRHLSRRRFAVFCPTGVFPPGYLFLYVFDAGKMLDRIRACPGVDAIVGTVSDAWVMELKADYFSQMPKRVQVASNRFYAAAKPKKAKVKTMTKAERKALSKVRKLLKKKGFKDSSTLESARKLEVHERIALLQKTANALTPAV